MTVQGDAMTREAPEAYEAKPGALESTADPLRMAEAQVGGKPVGFVPSQPVCKHSVDLMNQVRVGFVKATEDGSGDDVVRWDIEVKLICAECGVSFAFEQSAQIRQNGRAIVLQAKPYEGELF